MKRYYSIFMASAVLLSAPAAFAMNNLEWPESPKRPVQIAKPLNSMEGSESEKDNTPPATHGTPVAQKTISLPETLGCGIEWFPVTRTGPWYLNPYPISYVQTPIGGRRPKRSLPFSTRLPSGQEKESFD